jgi:hypothetical protein
VCFLSGRRARRGANCGMRNAELEAEPAVENVWGFVYGGDHQKLPQRLKWRTEKGR